MIRILPLVILAAACGNADHRAPPPTHQPPRVTSRRRIGDRPHAGLMQQLLLRAQRP